LTLPLAESLRSSWQTLMPPYAVALSKPRYTKRLETKLAEQELLTLLIN
jgi:hypothetical protein